MEITREQFTAAMIAAVEERGPEFVYPRGNKAWTMVSSMTNDGGCRYVRADVDEPACLIGVALRRCGVPIRTLRQHESCGANAVVSQYVDDHAVRSAAAEAQGVQDQGDTWGEALAEYMAELNRAR